ncbi:MAG: Methenyltetrahydrofolate cyclohydrolase [Firmicutes bacterium]|nr:Methenyltetrahydrofolate cyclohydrolase [Bacillota bacterium]
MSRLTEEKFSGIMDSIASCSPAPGGGTAAALAGVMAASLVEMVANLTLGRKKYAAVQDEMTALALEARELRGALGELAAEDARAYEEVMDAYKLPKESPVEQAMREAAVEKALHRAALVPLRTAEAALAIMEKAATVAARGNKNAQTDAAVASLLGSAAVRGALLNVTVNLRTLTHQPAWAVTMDEQCQRISSREEELRNTGDAQHGGLEPVHNKGDHNKGDNKGDWNLCNTKREDCGC